ncbi:transcription termination factor 1 [Dendrobates tinctorius]|uniref:transcription termination factor 1 n=1 Tax=Dendrobates tinctorius TaxID=92724 RepID=UPI003CC93FD7
MSMNLEEKLNPLDKTPHQDISNHALSGTENHVVTGNKLKRKRKFTNFNVMYMGSSDTEGMPKGAKYEQHNETESVPPVPKRKKKGDVYIEEQTDQESSGKKKKAKEESHQVAEDTRAHEKIKKSHKAKESKSGCSNEEAPDSKIAVLDGRSRKKKMKQKKDHGEHPLDDSLEEKLLTIDSQSAEGKKKAKRKDSGEESHIQSHVTKRKHQGGFEITEDVNESEDQAENGSVQELLISETQRTRKKKKRKDSGGLQEDAEELFSQLKRPNGSETLEQMVGINQEEKPAKKRKSKLDHPQVTDDIAADSSSPFVGLCIEASSCSELITKEYGLSQKKKKKSKIEHGKHSFTATTEPLAECVDEAEVHMKKKKSKKDSREPHQETYLTADDVSSSVGLHSEEPSFNEFSGTEDGVSRKKKKKSKKDHVNHPMEELIEKSMPTSTADANKKKTKRNDSGALYQDGFIEGFVSHRKSSDYPEQVVKNTDQAQKPMKKKKKERKDESHWEVGGIATDDVGSCIVLHQDIPEEIKKVQKVKEPKSLALAEESLYSEPLKIIDSSSVKKKSKKDGLLNDCLLKESTLTAQNISEKKTRREHGGDEGQMQHRQEGQSVDQAEAPGKKKKKHHVEFLLDDRLAEDSCSVDAQDTKKETKRTNDGDKGHRKHSFTATTEPVAECVAKAEVHMKKKKKLKKDHREPHQETDPTADDVSSSVGFHSEEPSINDFSSAQDGVSRKKKKKSKKQHKDSLLEDGLVEESSTPCVQHTRDKRAKWKDGRHESHSHHGFTEEFSTKKKHKSGSEKKEQMDENEEVEKPIKMKKKKQKDEPLQEVDDMTGDEASSAIGLCREEPSCSEFTDTEDMSRHLKKEKSNNHHWERFLENSLEEEDAEQNHRPQSSASPHTDPNPATREEHQATQNEREQRSATIETGKKRRQSIPIAVREQDVALLQEYLPRMTNPNAIKIMCCSELERVKAAKRSGIMYRSGQFTVEEDEIIRKNAQEFVSRFGIESPQVLFHPYLFPEVKDTVLQLKRKYRFQTRLADGLNRFTSHVYCRGAKLFSPGTVKGRFSNDEVAKLKMYLEAFGKKWQMIACELNRHYDSVTMKATQLHESNCGVWSTDETNRLIAAVKEFVVDTMRKEKNGEEPVTVPKRRLYTGIPWFVVQRKVETRVWTSCRIKWLNLMIMRMNNYINPFGKTLKIKAFIKVIRWLYDKNVKDYGDVKWDELSDHVGNIPTTSMQKTFHSWKKAVLGWKDMRLYDIVKGLYNDVLPGLEEKLSTAEDIDIEPETKDEFSISEIFREYEDCGEKFEA